MKQIYRLFLFITIFACITSADLLDYAGIVLPSTRDSLNGLTDQLYKKTGITVTLITDSVQEGFSEEHLIRSYSDESIKNSVDGMWITGLILSSKQTSLFVGYEVEKMFSETEIRSIENRVNKHLKDENIKLALFTLVNASAEKVAQFTATPMSTLLEKDDNTIYNTSKNRFILLLLIPLFIPLLLLLPEQNKRRFFQFAGGLSGRANSFGGGLHQVSRKK